MLIRSIMILLFTLACQGIHAQVNNSEFKDHLDSLYRHTVPLISVGELKDLNKENLYVLDTRETKEYKVSHLKNPRHVEYYWFDMRKVYDIPKDASIVLYCSVGLRSERIGESF
jgi:hypothetical protein